MSAHVLEDGDPPNVRWRHFFGQETVRALGRQPLQRSWIRRPASPAARPLSRHARRPTEFVRTVDGDLATSPPALHRGGAEVRIAPASDSASRNSSALELSAQAQKRRGRVRRRILPPHRWRCAEPILPARPPSTAAPSSAQRAVCRLVDMALKERSTADLVGRARPQRKPRSRGDAPRASMRRAPGRDAALRTHRAGASARTQSRESEHQVARTFDSRQLVGAGAVTPRGRRCASRPNPRAAGNGEVALLAGVLLDHRYRCRAMQWVTLGRHERR